LVGVSTGNKIFFAENQVAECQVAERQIVEIEEKDKM
jgi:hypothetical protein